MNIVVVCCDTLRYDYLGCSGSQWVRTPNIDRLAAQSVVFDNAWIGSYPTIPHRLECLTGQRGEPFQPWIPLPWDVETLPQLLARQGYVTMLMNTTPHLINHGFGYDRPFHAWQMFRGQEVDRYRTDPVDESIFPFALSKARAPYLMAQYYRNQLGRRDEGDYSMAQIMQGAAQWLARNQPARGLRHEKLFLWLDVFDVHEPWDPPAVYVEPYDPGYTGEEITFPKRGPCTEYTESERNHIRAMYAGSITFFDRWLGYLLDSIEAVGLADDTAILFMSDHGQHMGDHNDLFCKSYHLYHEMGRWVLMLKLPHGEGAGSRVAEALAQPVDLLPTLLDIAGAPPIETEGRSLRPLWQGMAWQGRELAFSGSALAWPLTMPVAVTDGRWSLIDTGDTSAMELFDLQADPVQQRNLAAAEPAQVQRLHAAVIDYLRGRHAPETIVQAFAEARPGGPRPELEAALLTLRARYPNVFVPENYVPFHHGQGNLP
jgi:arylsulfatase A-like enzyme